MSRIVVTVCLLMSSIAVLNVNARPAEQNAQNKLKESLIEENDLDTLQPFDNEDAFVDQNGPDREKRQAEETSTQLNSDVTTMANSVTTPATELSTVAGDGSTTETSDSSSSDSSCSEEEKKKKDKRKGKGRGKGKGKEHEKKKNKKNRKDSDESSSSDSSESKESLVGSSGFVRDENTAAEIYTSE